MKRILNMITMHVRKNAIEGAGKPSTRFAMESAVPMQLRTANEFPKQKKDK